MKPAAPIGPASGRPGVMRKIAARARRSAGALPTAWQAARALLPTRPLRNTADVRYAAVLDGRTLNLDIALPAGTATPPRDAAIVFTGRRHRHTAPARIRTVEDGVVRLSATVLLGEDGVGVHTEGQWQLSCVITDAAGRRSTHPLIGAPEPRWPSDGPTMLAPLCPRTGRRYEVMTLPDGRTGLTVRRSGRLAEVVDIRAGWTGNALEIRTTGFRYGRAPELRFTLRDDGATHTVTTTLDGDRIFADLPVQRLAETVTTQERLWDLHLIADGRTVRLNSVLTDLTRPKTVLRPPTSIVSVGSGVAVRVRPYFTPRGHLVLACLRLASAPAPRPASDDPEIIPAGARTRTD
ncbi:hypothetical protein EV385_6399 [Krasilnikovia cinnamomea]|uniref:Uncharacterized protein n=1 Tax=Krasilnikovia cinnamomea TaxID=349313 RepID=A0A4Q7ZT91_9ACTN|nr:hypothetical protein [Krasilnikovia cinnamomea]RZU54448.1 hypothetical protein EV385_6399 [Krasilnikovia cinnamomea]